MFVSPVPGEDAFRLQRLPGLFLAQSGQDGILKATEAAAVPKPLNTRSATVLLAASAGLGAHLSQPHITKSP